MQTLALVETSLRNNVIFIPNEEITLSDEILEKDYLYVIANKSCRDQLINDYKVDISKPYGILMLTKT